MSLKGGKAAGVDNTSRRTWDKEDFREKAEERVQKVGEEVEQPVRDAMLSAVGALLTSCSSLACRRRRMRSRP